MRFIYWIGWIFVWLVLLVLVFMVARTVVFGTIVLVGAPAGLLIAKIVNRIRFGRGE
jgi:hypothetical protein